MCSDQRYCPWQLAATQAFHCAHAGTRSLINPGHLLTIFADFYFFENESLNLINFNDVIDNFVKYRVKNPIAICSKTFICLFAYLCIYLQNLNTFLMPSSTCKVNSYVWALEGHLLVLALFAIHLTHFSSTVHFSHNSNKYCQ